MQQATDPANSRQNPDIPVEITLEQGSSSLGAPNCGLEAASVPFQKIPTGNAFASANPPAPASDATLKEPAPKSAPAPNSTAPLIAGIPSAASVSLPAAATPVVPPPAAAAAAAAAAAGPAAAAALAAAAATAAAAAAAVAGHPPTSAVSAATPPVNHKPVAPKPEPGPDPVLGKRPAPDAAFAFPPAGVPPSDLDGAGGAARRVVRSRTPSACARCKAAKAKCSEQRPCPRCLRSGDAVACAAELGPGGGRPVPTPPLPHTLPPLVTCPTAGARFAHPSFSIGPYSLSLSPPLSLPYL
jgi:hypothetical protein